MLCTVALGLSAQESMALAISTAGGQTSAVAADDGCAVASAIDTAVSTAIAKNGSAAMKAAALTTPGAPCPLTKCAAYDGRQCNREGSTTNCEKDKPTRHTCGMTCTKHCSNPECNGPNDGLRWDYTTPNTGNCP